MVQPSLKPLGNSLMLPASPTVHLRLVAIGGRSPQNSLLHIRSFQLTFRGFHTLKEVFDLISTNLLLRRFPFVRTDQPDHFRHKENSSFNQNYPVRSVKSYLHTRRRWFFSKAFGKTICPFSNWLVRPARSDKWKTPLLL